MQRHQRLELSRLARAGLGGRVDAVPTDDRCVPHDHPACNLRNLREAFAPDPAIRVHALTAPDGGDAPSLAQAQALLATRLGPFDVVFLRNVMIYFDRDTRREVVIRMHGVLRPGGILAVGSAETLSGLEVPFRAAAASIYTR